MEAVEEYSDLVLSSLDSNETLYPQVHEVLKNAAIADLLFWKLVSLGLMDFRKVLGRGLEGTVYQVEGAGDFLGMEVALKLFNYNESNAISTPVICGDVLALELPPHRHLCEVYGLLTYDQSNVHYIEAFDPEVHGGHLLLGTVSRAITGETLYDKMERGPLSVEETKRYGKQFAEALFAMHRAGVVHADIHPKNILIEDGSDHVQLIDFNGVGVATPGRMAKDWRRFAFLLVETAQQDLVFDPDFYDLIYSEKHGLLNGYQPYEGEQIINHLFLN